MILLGHRIVPTWTVCEKKWVEGEDEVSSDYFRIEGMGKFLETLVLNVDEAVVRGGFGAL